jgi:hypothetical protein
LQPDRIVAAKAVFELNNLSPGVLNLLIKPKDKGKDQLIGKFQLK